MSFPRSLLITYLLTLNLEKYSVVLDKVLHFGSKNLYEPCRGSVRFRLESHYLLDSNIVLKKKKRLLQPELKHLFIHSFILFVLFVRLFVFRQHTHRFSEYLFVGSEGLNFFYQLADIKYQSLLSCSTCGLQY